MVPIVVVCAGLLVGQLVDSSRPIGDMQTYEALKLKAGHDPEGQVKLALWCEARGLNAERVRHLAAAVLSDPRNAAARGLLGQLEFNGQWESLERAEERIKADDSRAAIRDEYQERRAKLTADEIHSQQAQVLEENGSRSPTAHSARLKSDRQLAQAHVKLGLWCKANGLTPEANAHFTAAIHFDPYRDSTWKHLGYVKLDGRWKTRDQAAIDAQEGREQRRADHYWEPRLKKWKSWLNDKLDRAQAEDLLAAVADRRAVPSILKVFPGDGPEASQVRRVRLLGQIDDPASSRALAAQATWTRFDSVLSQAIALLKTRPPRDYAADLVEMIRGPIKYEVESISGPNSRGALAVDAPRFRMLRTYDTPPAFELHSSFRGYVGYDSNGLPVVVSGRELDRMRALLFGHPEVGAANLREIELRTANLLAMATETARQQMAADIHTIETANDQARADNARIIPILKSAAGAPASLDEDEDAWHVWWYDKLGYSYQAAPKPTFTQHVMPQYHAPYIRDCFAAGTPVHTDSGPRPIEAIQIGDPVLSQDAATGALSFQPVVYVHRNPPDKTLRIRFSDGDSVVCGVYHRFWRANLGWAQAREIKPGDVLRAFGGTVRVDAVETDSVQALYNVDVATSRTFFVGQSKLLAHDNTLPNHRLVPFDALPAQLMGPAAGEAVVGR